MNRGSGSGRPAARRGSMACSASGLAKPTIAAPVEQALAVVVERGIDSCGGNTKK